MSSPARAESDRLPGEMMGEHHDMARWVDWVLVALGVWLVLPGRCVRGGAPIALWEPFR